MILRFATNESVTIDSDSLQNFNFGKYDLHRVLFEGLNLSGSIFVKAKLRGAFMKGANCQGCDFTEANLITSDCRGVDFSRANLNNIVAFSTDFENSIMIDASLEGAGLRDSNFREANLKGAIFTGADVSNADFSGARYDINTVWPDKFNPTANNCTLVSESSPQ